MTRMLTFIALLFATPAWAEIVLYCQDELATGIVKKNGRWQTGNFQLMRHTVKFDEKNMTLVGVSSYTPKALECSVPLKYALPDNIFCVRKTGQHELFNFNKRASGTRFMMFD